MSNEPINPTGITEPDVRLDYQDSAQDHTVVPSGDGDTWGFRVIYPDPRIVLLGVVEDETMGYEWEAFIILCNRETGRLHWTIDGGCSCTNAGDHSLELSKYDTGTRAELEKAFRTWVKGSYDGRRLNEDQENREWRKIKDRLKEAA